MAWKDIPEKKVLATLKDGKTFKGTASEKMTIYVDGAVPGGDGDVQGISMTIDPSTYVMTTQLKDGKGGDVGSPATVDLPLESMVVSGEYDEDTKSIILTLKNGQTVSFSVADLVSGLQTEITAQNPLSADLIEETTNKNFVTEQEKEDIDDIQNIRDSIAGIESDLEGKQDVIDSNNPLDADYIDDTNSDKKLVDAETASAMENLISSQIDVAGINVDSNQSNVTAEIRDSDADNVMAVSIQEVDDFNREVSLGAFENGSGHSIVLQEHPTPLELTDFLTTNQTIADIGLPDGVYKLSAQVYGGGVCWDENGNVYYSLYEEEALGLYTVQNTFDNTLGSIQTISHITPDGIKVWVVTDVDKVLVKEYTAGGSGGGGVLTLYMLDPFSTGSPEIGDHFEFCRDKELTDPITATELDAALNEGKVVQINGLYNAGDDWGPNYVTITDFYDDGSYGSLMFFTLRSSMADIGYRLEFRGNNDYATVIEIQSYNTQADWNEAYDSSSAFIKNKPTALSEFNNDMDFIDASSASSLISQEIGDVLGDVLATGSGTPPTATSGATQVYQKGQLYEDTTNGTVYVCTATHQTGGRWHYTWKAIILNGQNVSTLTNDAGYQDASQVSSAIATAVGQITSFEYQVVQALPQTGEKGVIYLVANSGTTPNVYDEYIWVNNTFEKIGTTDIDLSDYVTNSDLHDYTASVAFTSENGIEITDDDDNSIGFTIETDAETGSQNLAVTGSDGSFNVPNADDVADALAGKADAIDPSDLPSGSTQNVVITTSDHTDIDPSVVEEGQIVVDSTEGKVYIVSDITTDPQTGDPVIVWKEIQTDEMVILEYGTSTWNDFLTAYNDNRIVYCRAGSGTNPGSGTKSRLAFMAYVNNPTTPTSVEFQYVRSVNTKSDSQQCDQVFIYKLTNASGGTWSVETRDMASKIVAGTNMTSSYANGTLTLSADLSSKQDVIDANHKLSADLIDNSNSTNKTYKTGTGAPTTSTTGSVGELYVDSNTGKVYVCTDDTGGSYTWEEVGGTSAQTGSTAPSTSTVGEIGQIYVNTTDGKSYICTDTTGGTYTWVELIPTVNNATLTIQKNGVTVQTFTANASANKTANIEVPVITMQTTDPGEGVALAANNFIAVYEA